MNTMTFNDGIPKQVIWKGIYFDFIEAVKDQVLSEHFEDQYIHHILLGAHGNVWKGYQCLISVYGNSGNVKLHFFSENSPLILKMRQYCAVFERCNNRYRLPLDEKYEKFFPTIEQVYGYNAEEFARFNDLYFGDKIRELTFG